MIRLLGNLLNIYIVVAIFIGLDFVCPVEIILIIDFAFGVLAGSVVGKLTGKVDVFD